MMIGVNSRGLNELAAVESLNAMVAATLVIAAPFVRMAWVVRAEKFNASSNASGPLVAISGEADQGDGEKAGVV